MAAGLLTGLLLHAVLSPADARGAAEALSLVTRAFLRLIQMIIAPLVFSTLTAAVARAGDGRSLGRTGLRALGWFLAASVVSARARRWLRAVAEAGGGASSHRRSARGPAAAPDGSGVCGPPRACLDRRCDGAQ